MAGRQGHRGFGYIRRLPSGRYQASYAGPDLARHKAPATFAARRDAEAWLAAEHGLIAAEAWTSPALRRSRARAETFGSYAERWLDRRDLRPRTVYHYRRLLDHQLLPAFADTPLRAITSEMVRDWHADLDRSKPTLRSHAYGLLRTILQTAVQDEKIPVSPCHIRGAGTTKRVKQIKPATVAEIEVIAARMPPKYRPMVFLSSWCGLRFGEVTELRRKDLDLETRVIRVRRAVVRTGSGVVVGSTKSDAGVRDVAIPPHLVPMLRQHLEDLPTRAGDALLFTASDGKGHIAPSTLYRVFYPAREAAGRPDLRWHDLRHTGAVLTAQTGATLAELMARLGHSTPAAAMRYQHVAQGRDHEIANQLSALAEES